MSLSVNIAVELTFHGHLRATTYLVLRSLTEQEVRTVAKDLDLSIHPAADELIKRFKEKEPLQVLNLWIRWNRLDLLDEHLKIIDKNAITQLFLNGMMSWAVHHDKMDLVKVLKSHQVKVKAGQLYTYLVSLSASSLSKQGNNSKKILKY